MTTLDNSYCVPRTVEEWRELGVNKHSLDGNHECVVHRNGKPIGCLIEWATLNDYIEIPVTRFLDLTHDRICAWRVEEIEGHRYGQNSFHTINLPEHRCVLVHFEERVIVDARELDKGINIPNVPTFTDLLTLIRMLTPPSNAH